jgi:hypothetical protein
MDDEKDRTEEEDRPDTAEDGKSEEVSDKVPDAASGEGKTPLGATDEHSNAPGPDGTD